MLTLHAYCGQNVTVIIVITIVLVVVIKPGQNLSKL